MSGRADNGHAGTRVVVRVDDNRTRQKVMVWRLGSIGAAVVLVAIGIAFYELGDITADRETQFSRCREEELSRFPNPVDQDQTSGSGVTFLETCMSQSGYEVDRDRVSAVCEDMALNAQFQFCYGPRSPIRRWPYRAELIFSHL